MSLTQRQDTLSPTQRIINFRDALFSRASCLIHNIFTIRVNEGAGRGEGQRETPKLPNEQFLKLTLERRYFSLDLNTGLVVEHQVRRDPNTGLTLHRATTTP